MSKVINFEESIQFKLQARIDQLESMLKRKDEELHELKLKVNMTVSINELLRLQLQETVATLTTHKNQIDTMIQNVRALDQKLPNLTTSNPL